ncbi:uncharacterized protein [Watersipora subatra]|uniref:uncharacterized protein n=1 Tax=Watersipora subatra TaxID=2589382 RepID=UPI00355C78CC
MDHMHARFESAVNRVRLGIRARPMPKTVKKVMTLFYTDESSGTKQNWEIGVEADVQTDTVYYSQYIGSCLVDELVDSEPGFNCPHTGMDSKAISSIVCLAHRKQMRSISLTISKRGVTVVSLPTKSVILDVPFKNIKLCVNDPRYSKITAFIAKNTVNQTMECHAFLCHRQKLAKAIADTLSIALRANKERGCESQPLRLHGREDNATPTTSMWQDTGHPNGSETSKLMGKKPEWRKMEMKQRDASDHNHNLEQASNELVKETSSRVEMLIDDSIEPTTRARADTDAWAVFATETDNSTGDLEWEFSKFARSRSLANLTDLQISPQHAIGYVT